MKFKDSVAERNFLGYRAANGFGLGQKGSPIAVAGQKDAEAQRQADFDASITDIERATADALDDEQIRQWMDSPMGPDFLTVDQIATHPNTRITCARWVLAQKEQYK